MSYYCMVLLDLLILDDEVEVDEPHGVPLEEAASRDGFQVA